MGLKKCYLHLCDLSALVVTSQNGDSVLEADLKGHQEGYSLNRVVATIDVVTHEEVVSVRGLSSDLEQLAQVVELSVDVTADGHWGAHLLHVRLIYQNFFRLQSMPNITRVRRSVFD